jgi:hypothetical protein
MDEKTGGDEVRHQIVGLIVSVVCLGGCSTGQTMVPSETTTSEGRTFEAPAGAAVALDGNVLVRFMNADPTSAGMDVLADGESIFANVAFRKTTPYVAVPMSTARFDLREAGTTGILWTSRRGLFFGQHYTMVALPRENAVRLRIWMDNLFALEPGQVRVRVINATPNVDDLRLYEAGTQTLLGRGIDAGEANAFTDVDAGSLEIRPVNRPAPPRLSHLMVEAGRLYTYVVVGAAELDLVQIETALEDYPQSA